MLLYGQSSWKKLNSHCIQLWPESLKDNIDCRRQIIRLYILYTIVPQSLHYDLHLRKLIAVVLLRRSLAGGLHICLNKALSGRSSLQLL